MPSAPQVHRLLVISGDPDQARLLRQFFTGQAYEVAVAASGADGLKQAQARRPDLIILDYQLPDTTSPAITGALREQPRTQHVPILVLIDGREAMQQHAILSAGADDIFEKPLDVDILALSVRNALQRTTREGLTEPRSGLPTGRWLDEQIVARLRDKANCRIDVEIEGFNDFRDLHGFVTANEALGFAADLIREIAGEHGTPDDFIGHVAGSESFVIVTARDRASALGHALAARITPELESFYSFVEREQGYVVVDDGAGGTLHRPLMAAQVSVAGETVTPHAPPLDANSPAHADGPAFEW